RTKNTPGSVFDKTTDDYDRRVIQYYRDTLDASYSTSAMAYTGAQGGFPAGDLNWFPSKKAEWELWVATDVDDHMDNMPTTFKLNQNYPNPFNPSTKISFTLESAAKTTLTVYNILGQKVATLLSQELLAGYHEINFNASDLASGVYLFRLDSGNFTAVKKMMIMK
ncbi:MAG: T9SS type A sorting domain-containing protein, partial [Ignavibacteriaceae bacterium]|nr:T9SS type A sorting domain-containing protein [Ignavibacteriaceae bacterium]